MKRVVFIFGVFLIGACFSNYGFAETAGTHVSFFERTDNILADLGKPISFDEEETLKVRVDGEFRYRLEYRDDFNFNNGTFEDDGFSLLRTRLGLHADLGEGIHLYVQGQDSESFASREAHKGAAFVNRLDLHQLYAEIKSPWEDLPLKVKVGRQELSYGDQRFVGAFGWSNVARVFDAVKLVFTPSEWFKVDAWFSQVVQTNRSQPDSANHNDNFYGIYTSLTPEDKNVILDTFLFVRRSREAVFASEIAGRAGHLNEYTLGNRLKAKKWNFDFGFEWASQFGSRGQDNIHAWAWHYELGYTFPDIEMTPRISFEYNHATGDSDPTDGNFENFDNLFPTNHIHYGYMDFQSLRNTHNFKLGLEAKPCSKVKLMFGYHWFFLDTNNSAWFNAGQGAIRAANSGASTTVGQELDLLVKIKLSKHMHMLIGYSHFHAGAFIKDTGTANDANFFYVQTGIKI